MKILLLGKNGQLGWELQRALAPLGEVLACGREGPQALEELSADLAQPARLPALIELLRPDLIVNAAAYTAVDQAEGQAELAHQVNAVAPGVLATCAAALGVPLVHYSTDYVFDGSGEHARDEEAPTGPLNVYGRSKLEGEARIRASGCRHLVLRTSWVHARRGGNFARTMLRLAAERDALKVIDDQIGAPTGADLLADITAHCVRPLLGDPSVSGTYHCVAAGHTSWHGYARFLIQAALERGFKLKTTPQAVAAIPTRDYPTPARRPLNSRLATDKLQRQFGLRLPPWQDGVLRWLIETLPPESRLP